VTFIRDYLGPTFKARGLDTMIAAPDTAHLPHLPGYMDALVADKEALDYVDVIATHPYESEGFDLHYSVPADNGKPLWQTEVSQEGFPQDTPDPSMTSALEMVRMMHEHLTVTQVNAWNWWLITAASEDYEEIPTARTRR
jgi:O-glycosyl hydrolase